MTLEFGVTWESNWRNENVASAGNNAGNKEMINADVLPIILNRNAWTCYRALASGNI